jgi:hypothetical protein
LIGDKKSDTDERRKRRAERWMDNLVGRNKDS